MKTRILALILIACLFLLNACSSSDQVEETESVPVDSIIIELSGQDSVSVLDLLTAKHMVNITQTSAGAFVKGINSVKAGNGYFWLYSVNDTMPKTAADNFITSESDKIRWIFRKQ